MDRSKRFYIDVLGLRVVADHGDFVQFEAGFALHDGASLHPTVFGSEPEPEPEDERPYGRRNLVLYFEVDDLDEAFARIGGRVDLIYPIERQKWGQRVFRLFDPDRHIVEVGEPQ